MSTAADDRWQPLRVRAVVDETHDARSVWFDVPPESQAAFAYRPGQFVTLRLPVAGRWVPRCYSMSSAPGLDDGLRVTVKRVAGGRGSNWVCDHVKAGDTLQVQPPSGVFTPKGWAGDLLLFAGGSGITPVLSILRSALAQGSGRVTLLYANRDERSVIFRDTLNALAAEHADRFQVVHWLDSVQRVPTVAQLAAFARPAAAMPRCEAFVCGPGPFMDAAAEALRTVGLAGENVHTERFVSLPDEGAAPPPPPVAADDVTLVDDATLTIDLDGQTHRLRSRTGETLLDTALRAGLAAPHACREGLCGACRCTVVQGSVHLRLNEALDARDLSRGWTLACQALPASDALLLRYP